MVGSTKEVPFEVERLLKHSTKETQTIYKLPTSLEDLRIVDEKERLTSPSFGPTTAWFTGLLLKLSIPPPWTVTPCPTNHFSVLPV